MFWGVSGYSYPVSSPSNVHVPAYTSGCSYYNFDMTYPPQMEGFVDPQSYVNAVSEITARFNEEMKSARWLNVIPLVGLLIYIILVIITIYAIRIVYIVFPFFFVFIATVFCSVFWGNSIRRRVPLRMNPYLNEMSAKFPGTVWRLNSVHFYRATAFWIEICLDLSRRGGVVVSSMPMMGGMQMGGMPMMGGMQMGGMPMGGMPTMGGMPMTNMGGMPMTNVGMPTSNTGNMGISLAPPAYSAPVGSGFCAKCGTLRSEDAYCKSCGNRY